MRLTKRNIDALPANGRRYFVWDDALSGFGLRVEVSGHRVFVCRYRSSGRRRQYAIGRFGVVTAEQARQRAQAVLSAVRLGEDPAAKRDKDRITPTLRDLTNAFFDSHGVKLKPRTREEYRGALELHVMPLLGRLRADAVTRSDVGRLHASLSDRPYRANRVIAYLGSVYSWAMKSGNLSIDQNPCAPINRFREDGRTRFLTSEELERLGATLTTAETIGLPWKIIADEPQRKHVAENQLVVYPHCVTGAIRLLLLTGCRLREILTLRWRDVDLERGILSLPDSKTGRKFVVLNKAAAAILLSLERKSDYVVPGGLPHRPRHDLKRPWEHIRAAADLNDLRLHDLRHTHASIGASAGFGLPVIGRLLGHASPLTTQRYAHLADDPLRRASEHIGDHVARAIAAKT